MHKWNKELLIHRVFVNLDNYNDHFQRSGYNDTAPRVCSYTQMEY